MELPQSRPFGTEGRKPTQDFLSLYSHSTVQQDPRPPSQGGFLKTHDFLRVGKTSAKDESTVEISSTVEKPPPPAPPPPPPPSSVLHILPGGIGSDKISHISYFGQKVPKPEGTIFTIAQACNFEKNDENSNGSSYTGSGFTLWEESAVKKGKTGKENARSEIPISREATVNAGQWASQSFSNNNNSFSSLSYSQPPGLKSQSFMEMIKSAKGSTHDADLDDEDEFVLKKEDSTTTATTTTTTTHTGEFRVKVDGMSNDQKPNTPRSKHSATEQRRRSKINDRFQMLREIIPHSDQKRDKASFMLEVIEYIQFLQEKVHKYEGPYVGWNQEPAKLAPWRNNHKPAESYVDQPRGMKNNGSATALVFSAKLDDKKVSISPAVESDMSTATTFKRMDHQPGVTNKAMPFPMSLQPNCYNSVRNGGVGTPIKPRLASDAAEITTSQPQAPISHTRSCTGDIAVSNDKLKEQELTVEGGTINISTVYSHGLLNTLTQALQSSGVDLSKARVSVQIDLGKRAAGRSNAPASIIKDNEVLASNQGTQTTRSRDRNGGEGSNQALKKQKTHKN